MKLSTLIFPSTRYLTVSKSGQKYKTFQNIIRSIKENHEILSKNERK